MASLVPNDELDRNVRCCLSERRQKWAFLHSSVKFQPRVLQLDVRRHLKFSSALGFRCLSSTCLINVKLGGKNSGIRCLCMGNSSSIDGLSINLTHVTPSITYTRTFKLPHTSHSFSSKGCKGSQHRTTPRNKWLFRSDV